MYHVSADNSRPDNYPPLLRRPRKVNCLHHIQNNNLVSLLCFAWVKFVDNFHNLAPFNVLSHKSNIHKCLLFLFKAGGGSMLQTST